MNLEHELRNALRREDPPADFSASVLRKTSIAARPRPVIWAIAATIAAAALIPSAYQYQQHQRAVQARDQLVIALSITRAQIEHSRDLIQKNMRHRQ